MCAPFLGLGSIQYCLELSCPRRMLTPLQNQFRGQLLRIPPSRPLQRRPMPRNSRHRVHLLFRHLGKSALPSLFPRDRGVSFRCPLQRRRCPRIALAVRRLNPHSDRCSGADTRLRRLRRHHSGHLDLLSSTSESEFLLWLPPH